MNGNKTYRYTIWTVLFILLAIPCHVKKEIKLILDLPTPTIVVDKTKIICSQYTQDITQNKEVTVTPNLNPTTYYSPEVDNPIYTIVYDIELPDVFAYLHIKVPERILHQQFLI